MKLADLGRAAASILAAMLTACGESRVPALNSTTINTVPGTNSVGRLPPSYQLLYSFSGPVGSRPLARLTYVNGSFFGTTYRSSKNTPGGALFALDSHDMVSIVHDFLPVIKGHGPVAGVTDLHGTLYGTTFYGAKKCQPTYCDGIIYRIAPSGADYKIIYSFTGQATGMHPNSDLVALGGTLYGTTQGASAYGCYVGGSSSPPLCGTVFSITPAGRLTTVYAFKDAMDGWIPNGVVAFHGTLYGTTYLGGTGCGYYGCGTVFSVTPSGIKQTLHKFKGKDGQYPLAGLTVVGGALYGTTSYGGCCGTVFKVSLPMGYRVIHNFKGGSTDGSVPFARMLSVNGTLYGTTYSGGAYGCGIVFSMSTSGQESVLYNFQGTPNDGCNPAAELTYHNGTLYGTTEKGGSLDRGTIFSLTP